MKGLYIGLSEKARTFVSGKKTLICVQYVTQIFPNGKKIEEPPEPFFIWRIKKEDGEGIEDTDFLLNSYTFSNDQVFKEVVQEERTRTIFFRQSSSVYFTALKNDYGEWIEEYLWSKEEMDEVMKKLK